MNDLHGSVELKKLLFGLMLLLVVAVGLWRVSKLRRFQLFGDLVARVETADSVVALTFDDGPTPVYTEEVLALLRASDVPATFFLTGREVEAYPDEARRIAADGHDLGNHSYSHPQLVFKRPSVIREEVERTDAAIRAAGYTGVIRFRPPYGKKLVVLPWYLARTGRTTLMWDVEPESYPDVAADPEALTAHVLDRVRPGSIILLHVMYESRQTSREALPEIIDGLRARGYRFVTLSTLFADSSSLPNP